MNPSVPSFIKQWLVASLTLFFISTISTASVYINEEADTGNFISSQNHAEEMNINTIVTESNNPHNTIVIQDATPVESIIITANGQTTLKDRETLQLTATVTPASATDATIVWQSDNEKVASVADGIVTAHHILGIAHIKAIAPNGVSAEIEITVVETPVESISIGYSGGESNELLDGDSLYVSAQVFPATATNPYITWSVSDESIINIDFDGKVKALYPGEAQVYAESSNGIKESLLVIVKPILIERIDFTDHFTIPLYSKPGVRTQVKLEPQVYPENASIKSLHWTSSNYSVGMIPYNIYNEYVFWATGLGSTTITCYAEDGSGISHSIDVNVINPITGIRLKEHNITLTENQTFELVATIDPIDATGSYISWFSSDENIATVDNGLVKALAEGKCKITVHGTAGLGTSFTDECNITVSKKSSIPTVSFDDVNIKIDNNQITVENIPAECTASLYDLKGINLMSRISTGEDIVFNVNSTGYYIVSYGKYAIKVCIN